MELNKVDLLGEYIRAMIKGENGTGKSILASSFPDPHFFFFEKRWKSLISYWMKVNPSIINKISFDDLTGMSKYKVIETIKYRVDRPDKKTLVLDSITSAGDEILSTIKSGKAEGKVISGIRVNDGEDFSAEDAFFKELKELMFSFSGNVIWIAHVLIIEQQNMMKGTTTISRPIVSGAKKIAAKLPGYFDEVWHTQVENGRYKLLTTHRGTDMAKTSLPLDSELDFTDGNGYDLIHTNLERNYNALIKRQQDKEALLARQVKI